MFPTVFISFHMLSYALEADLDPFLLQVLLWILERAWAIFLAQPTIYILKLLHILSIFPSVPLYKALFLVLLLPLPPCFWLSQCLREKNKERTRRRRTKKKRRWRNKKRMMVHLMRINLKKKWMRILSLLL